MSARVGAVFFFVLSTTTSWVCDGRQLVSESSVVQINDEGKRVIQPFEEGSWDENVCTLCVEYASQACNYIGELKNQNEIVENLHLTCSRVPPRFKQLCIALVDYYAPLIMSDLPAIEPKGFCRNVNLCEKTAITYFKLQQDSCGVCHLTVAEALDKLKDPDTQLEIIELLLKACNSADQYAKKCKKMVFEYGPTIIVNAEQFLETKDLCTILHACNAGGSERASQVVEESGRSDS